MVNKETIRETPGILMQPWLRFFRIRLLPTAISNVLLGVFVGAGLEGTWSGPSTLAVLALAALVYAFGMGLNDYVDRNRDRTLHPERPLPRGDISPPAAARGLGVLLVGSIGLGFGLGWFSGVTTLVLIAAATSYNAFAKGQPATGPLCMGAVRFTLVILGASVTNWEPTRELGPWFVGVVVGGYVSLLTYFSMEEETKRPPILKRRALFVELWILGVAISTCWLTEPEPLLVVVGWGGLAVWLERFALGFIRTDPPRPLLTTLHLLMALCLLDMALLLSYDLLLPAGVAGGLWLSTLRPGKLRLRQKTRRDTIHASR